MIKIVIAAAVVFASMGATLAAELPAACPAADAHGGHGAADAMPMAPAGDDAHDALMAGMDEMNADMMRGGAAEDIDVAFACSMIPHHRGAIDMAKAVLEHGDDPWIRELAQQVVTAQEQEIAQMEAWLAEQAR